MPLDFPNSPTTGQTYTGPNNVVWQWDSQKWVAGYGAATAYAPIASPVFTGDPQAPTQPASDADASIATTAFVAPSWNNEGRNLVHNSQLAIAQRGNGPFSTNTMTLDRWRLNLTNDTANVSRGTPTDAERTQVGDETMYYCLSTYVAGNAASNSITYITQGLENVRRLAGKTVTVSFWSNATAGMKIGVNIMQGFGTGGSSAQWVLATGASFSLSGTWARYSATMSVPSVAGKTIATDGTDGSVLSFFYSSGSGSNALAGNIGVQTGTINIWGVQLEIGSVATPLAKRDIADELALCQRFYQTCDVTMLCIANVPYSGSMKTLLYPVVMRAAPTVTQTHTGGGATRGVNTAALSNQTEVWFAGSPLVGDYESIRLTFSADL